MMWWGSGFGWGWMIFGGLMMLVFWGGLIALAVRASFGLSQLAGPVSVAAPARAALDTLKERYARGEITRAEYDEMRDHLAA